MGRSIFLFFSVHPNITTKQEIWKGGGKAETSASHVDKTKLTSPEKKLAKSHS